MSSQHLPEGVPVPPPSIEEVATGVYAYVQLDGSWFLNNAGCITGSRSATVIDATGTEARGRAWRTVVRAITPKPVTTLVNTHHHADHTNGNFLFAPETVIVGHELCREEIVRGGTFPRSTPLFPGTDFGDCPPAPPVITFKDRLDLWVDDQLIQLHYLGPSHTTNDVAAWLPGKRILFSGDVLFNGGTPFMLFGSLAGSIEALDRLEAFQAATIIPGHGAVCGPEVIGRVRKYLHFIRDSARAGFEKGADATEWAATLTLGEFAELTDSERLVPNIHRAYSELRGEPRGTALDLGKMFAAMVAYNGGKPLRCLA